MDLIIVTGMSGAGKTQAINALEDIGYYCVDNVPPRLVSKFAELPVQSDGKITKIALVVDVRSRELFADFIACLEELKATDCSFKILFLDCDEQVLLHRYKETRRRHPLLAEDVPSMEQAIRNERDMLHTAKSYADLVIDTTHISSNQMKAQIRELFTERDGQAMHISVVSFGFKRGTPSDADLVFDVRCLPNPFYVQELREKTGQDKEVRDYVMGTKQAVGLVPRLLGLVDYLIPLYMQEGKSRLVIAIGCTGGKHRSVTFAELLGKHFAHNGVVASVSHRDVALPPVV